jgi:hypothetical protein
MTHGDSGEHEDVAGFCNRFVVVTMVKMQRVLGTMSRKDSDRWLNWARGSQGAIVDLVRDPDDALPAFVHAAQFFLHALRHPRAFIRQYGLEGVRTNVAAFENAVAGKLSH